MIADEHRRFIIDRLDHYYDSINNKGNAFLAINTFISGGLFASIAVLPTYLKEESSTLCWILLMLAVNLISTLFTLTSLIPYSRSNGQSLVYFGDIADLEFNSFLQKFVDQSNSDIINDLNKQIFYLSKGLKKKFMRLEIAGKLFFVEAVILAPLILCIIKNLK